MKWPSDIRYFRKLGSCQCGKPATGWLMNSRNDQMAVACERCAAKAVKAASEKL